MVLGTGFAPFLGGPLRLADTWGLGEVVSNLDRLAQACGPRFKPCALLHEMQDAGRKFFETAPQATVN
jgi:3-hydroxyacyl-CoA dehydrogenase/enoyl-CoA hydratase/3-hydroxybutyryl-CoA epimerase